MSDETDPEDPKGKGAASREGTERAEPRTDPEPEQADVDEVPDSAREVLIDEVDLKDALRGALQPPPGAVAPSLLRGVQKKLRVRSRGKFYGDGWSTAASPRTTYLVTSVIMLLLVAIVFFALIPYSSGAP